ncbi:hypothetical protein MKX03_013502 [Papaver bracteatum]|nr:hypothetical protein MKX03_013502 [Papaver bracteatum]
MSINPILPSAAEMLDYSLNNLTSTIPNISSYLSEDIFISYSSNQLSGNIPTWICKAKHLEVLDASHNSFSGPIPQCLGSMANLITLNLNQNRFEGEVAKSLVNCTMLEVLDVGNNRLTGTFPSWLGSNQMQTYPSSSFEGNDGLCGIPLSKECNSVVESPRNGSTSKNDHYEFDWILFLVTFLGFLTGACMVIGPQYFWKQGREWVNQRINRILNIT